MLRKLPKAPVLPLALALGALLLVPGLLFAQAQARVEVVVVDEKGEPVPDVTITITSAEIGYHEVLETNKRGKAAVIFVDGTRNYDFQLAKEGFETLTQMVDPKSGGNLKKELILPRVGSGAAGGETTTEPSETADPSINVFNEGVLALQAGDAETAKRKFHRAMEMNPKMVEPPAALAGIYAEEGDDDQALAMAEKTVVLEPGNARALRVLYDIYKERGENEKAAEALEQLKTAAGGTDTAARIFNEGVEAARLGDVDAARARFEEALSVDPELAPAHAAVARVYLVQEEYDLAIEAARKAQEIDPGNTSALKTEYEAHRQKGDIAAAQEVFAKLSEADPAGTAGALYERGVAMFNAGDMAGATQAFEQSLQADPDQAKAHYHLGLAYVNTGDSAKAKEHLQRFLEMAPEDPDAGTAKEMLDYLG